MSDFRKVSVDIANELSSDLGNEESRKRETKQDRFSILAEFI